MNLIRENGKGLWQHKTDRKSSLSGTVCLSYAPEILKSIIMVVFNNVSLEKDQVQGFPFDVNAFPILSATFDRIFWKPRFYIVLSYPDSFN